MMADTTKRLILDILAKDDATPALDKVSGSATKTHGVFNMLGNGLHKLGDQIGGELGGVLNTTGDMFDKLGSKAHGIAPSLQIAGAGIAGLGAGLAALGSADHAAQASLSAAIQGTGHNVDQYKTQIEDVIKQQENFNHSAADTTTALTTLTSMTGSPTKALDNMGLVANIAAMQHVSLNKAAMLVGKTLEGGTALFKRYGIAVSSVTTAQKSLSKAEQTVKTDTDKLSAAKQHLADVERKVHDGTLKGKAAQDELKKALAAVTKAADILAQAQALLKGKHDAVTAAQKSQTQGLDALNKKTSGQAAASTDSFIGRLDVLKTKALDAAAAFGNKYGNAITIAGTVMSGFGTVLDMIKKRQAAAAAAAAASTVATEAETVATDAQTVSTEASTGALSLSAVATLRQAAAAKIAAVAGKAWAAAQWLLNIAMDANPIGLVVIAIAALAAGFIYAWQHSETFRKIVTTAFQGVSIAIGWVLDTFGNLLGALGHVPGFGWASSAAKWLHEAATNTRDFGAAINGLPANKKLTITTVYKTVGGQLVIQHGPKASGGYAVNAGGTPDFAGGDSLVGEHGPEIVRLPRGAAVISNEHARYMARGSGGPTYNIHIHGVTDSTAAAKEVQKLLLKLKRTNGGRDLGIA